MARAAWKACTMASAEISLRTRRTPPGIGPARFDRIHRAIVELLQENGNLSNVEIARRLSISEDTVRRRRTYLHEDDVIRVVAVANPFKPGYRIMAFIGVQTQKTLLSSVEQTLQEMPEVRFLGVTLGTYDLMLEAWFKSNDELLRFVTVDLATIQGITRTESFQIMRLSKYTYDWGQPTAGGE
jgi:Lrp/AsnC family transcriptional regulator, regulator for asnA, asnC and gidA